MKSPKNHSTQKIKEIEENLFELEKRLFNFKKYRHQDDFEQKNLRDLRNLFNETAFNEIAFNQSIYEDYYKPIKTIIAFNDIYIL